MVNNVLKNACLSSWLKAGLILIILLAGFAQISLASGPPIVTILAATNVTSTSADIHGKVNPNGLTTNYYFFDTHIGGGEWRSPTPKYYIGSGTSFSPAYFHLSGLKPNTIYYYRLAAENSADLTLGGESFFTTPLSDPPNTPSKPVGPTTGDIGTPYTYSASATDPNGNDIFYTFYWDDNTIGKSDIIPSKSKVYMSHIWNESRTYNIKVKATDMFGFSSGWSSILTVTISPKPPSTGIISITSSPSGAEVLVDGVSKGTASPTLDVPGVNPGSRTVKCRLSGYMDYETTIIVSARATTSVTCSLPPPGSFSVKVSSNPLSIELGNTSTITVIATGSNGAPLSGASVTLATTPGGTLSPASGITDSNGQFNSTFTGTSEGTVTIKAQASKTGFSNGLGELQVEVSPEETSTETVTPMQSLSVEITSEPASIEPDQTSIIRVTVTGSDKKPISGAGVALISTSGGTLTPESGTTDPSGQFTSTFTGHTEGAVTVEASVSNIKSEVQIMIKPRVNWIDWINKYWWLIAAIVIVILILAYLWFKRNLQLLPKQTSIPCDGTSTLPIKVQFVNAFGKLRKQSKPCEVEMETISGKIQNVMIPAGKEFAEATLISSNECGQVTITAKSGSKKATAKVDFVVNKGCLDVQVSPSEIPADGKSTATVTVKVKDDKGNNITYLDEMTVDLTTTLGTIESPMNISPKTPAGTATITSGQIIGTAIIKASMDEIEGKGEVVFAELPGRYCMHCGAKLPIEAQTCPKCRKDPPSGVDTKQCSTPDCGADLPLSAKFCYRCGARQPV